MKRARTVKEIDFATSLTPCPQCGARETGDSKLRQVGVQWLALWNCPRCGADRKLEVATFSDPLFAPPPAYYELGQGVSELIDPETFLAELVAAQALIPAEPTALDVGPWRAGDAAIKRALICVNELSKMISADADRVPNTTDSRLTRAWLDGERSKLEAIAKRYLDDSQRVQRLELANEPPPPIGNVDRAALEAHLQWRAREGRGEGRLVLRHHRLQERRFGSVDFRGAELSDCDLTKANLSGAMLDDATLLNCILSGANLDMASFSKATISGGSWTRARLAAVIFDSARVDGTDFTKSDLERARWSDAHVTGATFDGARIGNSTFDGAAFERCSFKDASFAKATDTPEPTTKAKFVACDFTSTDWSGRDLRNATFERCTFRGAHGKPSATDGMTLRDCDVDAAALTAQLR